MNDEEEIDTEQDKAPPVQVDDDEAKAFLKELKRQEKRRTQQELAEARELKRQAKELERQAKERRKTRKLVKQHEEYVDRISDELGLDPDRPVTQIPAIDDPNLVEVEFTTIQEERSYVRVLFDEETNNYLYQVIEPQLNETESAVREFLRDTLVRTLDGRYGASEDWEETLVMEIEQAIVDHSVLVDQIAKERLKYYLLRDFLGYGEIDVMMKDPMIEDISCDGPGIPVFVFHRQYESIESNVVFDQEHELDSYVLKLAQRAGKHISIANPLLDATLPDTSRLQATLSREVTTRGSSFTIRRFRADPLTPPDLVRLGTMSEEMAAYLWLAIENGSSILFSGGTASGKTTTLNASAQFIPPNKKIVSIEDTREINLEHQNWIAGLTRHGFGGEVVEGKTTGTIDMYDLLESALRQRPEYLLVGEVRGPEAQTLFQAMATGHATYSTLHADSPQSAVYRLENEPINVPRRMLSQLDVIAVQRQVREDNQNVRRLANVTEITGIDAASGDLMTNTVFERTAGDGFDWYGSSDVFEKIADTNDLSDKELNEEWEARMEVLRWMVDKGIRNISDVASVVSGYYANPDQILSRVRRDLPAGKVLATAEGSNPDEGEAD